MVVYDLTTGRALREFKPDGGISGIALSPDGSTLAIAGLIDPQTREARLSRISVDGADSREAYKVRQYARAERLTLASRDFADRASRMVGPPREDPDYVEHVLRRTDDALDRAKDVLKTGAGRDAWNQHDALHDAQKDAWKVFKVFVGETGLRLNRPRTSKDGDS